jgi:DNA-binding MarR family transcriptional regulator
MAMFYESSRSIDKLYNQYAKSEGMTFLGYLILDIICSTPENCTQKLICEQTLLPKQTVNTIIRSFWEQGYVEMREIDSDRRNKAIRLSETGQKFADKVMKKISEAEEAAMGQLTHEQRQSLIEIIQCIEKSLRKSLCDD